MHKRLITCFVVSLMIVTLCGAGHAALIVGTDVVYDDVSGLTWMKDLSKFTNRTYDEQITDIGVDTTAGITDWHMATHDEIVTLWTGNSVYDIMPAFIPSLHEEFPIPEIPGYSIDYWDWVGRIDEESTTGSHYTWIIRDSN